MARKTSRNLSSALINKRHVFFIIIMMEILVYGVMNYYTLKGTAAARTYYTLSNHNQTLHNSSIYRNCTDDPYPNNYYRKPIRRDNYTYYAYAVSVGKILAEHLTRNQTKSYKRKIHHDLIYLFNAKHLNRSAPEKAAMYQTYLQYYYNYHFPPNSTIQCPHDESIDFFTFIQIHGEYTNATHEPPLNFYGELPMEHVVSSGPYSSVSHIANKSHYLFPKLFSYTLSVDESGDLRSLELRFVEIVDVLQHDTTRHLLLNGVRGHLLWAGEFYYIYDHKYNEYVLIMDSASGHFRPNMDAKPGYLERILMRTLFPHHVNTNEYRPVKVIGYQEKPWHRVKPTLFPILNDINRRDTLIYLKKKRERSKQNHLFLENKPCHILIAEFTQRIMVKTGHSSETALKYAFKVLNKFHIKCEKDGNAKSNGWVELTDLKELVLYEIFNKY
eukprot:164817_1